MAPRKVVSEDASEPRRSSRIADMPKSTLGDSPLPKPRVKKGTNKRGADTDALAEEKKDRRAKKAKGSEEEQGEEHDELADDNEDVKTLDIGDVLPSITLRNEKEEEVNLAELTAEKGLVLFLVPKADTPGCTKQACGFRDSYPDFAELNFNVYCVSGDTASAQAKWQTKQNLPYSLLSDRQQVLIKALGAADGKKTTRSHFIFEKGGKLLGKKMPVKPVESPQQALQFIKTLQT